MNWSYVAKRVRPVVNYYGSKVMICRRILELAPPHTTYVEGYAGGLSILLNKFQSDREIACDINEELVNFYHVLVGTPEKVIDKVEQITFGKAFFGAARTAQNQGDELTRAVNFLVRHCMSYSGHGMSWAGDKSRRRSWADIPNDLAIVANRLRGVNIVLRKAFDVIQEYDSPETWFYLDPPYYNSTRVSPKMYIHEMSEMDHLRLLRLLPTLKGSVILSGYANLMYDEKLSGWDRVEIEVVTFSSPLKNEKSRRTEILWIKQPQL